MEEATGIFPGLRSWSLGVSHKIDRWRTRRVISFETKTLFLKQVRVTELDEAEKTALRFFFPGYHEGSGFQGAERAPFALATG